MSEQTVINKCQTEIASVENCTKTIIFSLSVLFRNNCYNSDYNSNHFFKI